jgi:serine-protein kinase ATM
VPNRAFPFCRFPWTYHVFLSLVFVLSTQSVAVSSVVGHVLGIGDRHCSNILIHKRTGEVVHIDFGIVFEQGKLLATPELVPFRLTQNIVDGFGPGGTEGAFTLVAEATLTTLKENSDSLLTILSVRAVFRWPFE